MDRLTSLTVFARVVENGGFSAAARRLNMSTTVVSNHVQALEDRLGARLLNRTTRKVSLTEIGQQYYERCIQILFDLEEADSMAGSLHSTPRGTLRIYTSTHIMHFIAPVTGEYLEANPEVTIDLTIGERMVDLVEEGYDIAIRTIPPPDSSLIVRRLTPWRHILCCSPDYAARHEMPKTLSDLTRHNCMRYVFYPFGDEWTFIDAAGKTASIRIGGNVVTNSAELLRLLTLRGQGLCLAPSFVVADDVASGKLTRVLPHFTPVEFSISALYLHRLHLSAKIRSFIDLLAVRMADHRRLLNPEEPPQLAAASS